MSFGTMFLGEVESLGPESIQTKFFVLGVPLFPISSHYVVGAEGFEIPLHRKSIGLGYLRIATWMIAALCLVFLLVDRRQYGELLVWALGAGAIAVVSTFAMGRLSADERTRRTLLSMATGLGAPPELLPADARATTTAQLEDEWEKTGGGRPWDKAIEGGDADSTLFALAEYADRRDLSRLVLENFGRSRAVPSPPYR